MAEVSPASGRGFTTTDTMADVEHSGLLLTVTVNVVVPVGKPVAVAVAVVASVSVTLAGALQTYV